MSNAGLSPLVKAKPMSVKTLFLHGSDDCFVSCKHSEKLHKQMGVSHSRYEQIPSAGHTDVFEFEEAWYKIVEFLKDLFPKYSHSILSNSAHVVHSRGETSIFGYCFPPTYNVLGKS